MALSRVRYLTAGGLEVPPVTAAGMREIDRIAVEETGPNLFQMMENAGRNLALQAIEVLGPGWREPARSWRVDEILRVDGHPGVVR